MADFDKDLIISLSKLLEKTGLSEIEIENKEVVRIKVAKNLINTSVLPSSPIPQSETNTSVEQIIVPIMKALKPQHKHLGQS